MPATSEPAKKATPAKKTAARKTAPAKKTVALKTPAAATPAEKPTKDVGATSAPSGPSEDVLQAGDPCECGCCSQGSPGCHCLDHQPDEWCHCEGCNKFVSDVFLAAVFAPPAPSAPPPSAAPLNQPAPAAPPPAAPAAPTPPTVADVAAHAPVDRTVWNETLNCPVDPDDLFTEPSLGFVTAKYRITIEAQIGFTGRRKSRVLLVARGSAMTPDAARLLTAKIRKATQSG